MRRALLSWKTLSFSQPAHPDYWRLGLAGFYAHIASPDVQVDDEKQQVVMYVHERGSGAALLL